MFRVQYITMEEIMGKENTSISFMYCLFFHPGPLHIGHIRLSVLHHDDSHES